MLKSPYAPVLVAGPVRDVVSLVDARVHCHVDEGEWDALLGGLIAAALAYCDGWRGVLGRCLLAQTWRVEFDCWEQCLRLPFPDVVAGSVVVTFVDADGAASALDAGSYDVLEDAVGGFVRFRDAYGGPGTLAEVGGVRVAAQFAAPEGVVAQARQAMLLMVGHWFANREAVNVGNITSVLPMGAEMLLAPLRRVGV